MTYQQALSLQKFNDSCGVRKVYRTREGYECYNKFGKLLTTMDIDFGSKHFPVAEFREAQNDQRNR